MSVIFERSLKDAELREELKLLVWERDLLEKLLTNHEGRRTPDFARFALLENDLKVIADRSECQKKIEGGGRSFETNE